MTSAVEIVFVGLLGYFLALNSLYLAITVAGLADLRRQRSRRQAVDLEFLATSPTTLPVSILMPAYNEGLVLGDAVRSLMASDYPEFEVIVVNDGSTDAMLETAILDLELEPRDLFHPAPLPTARVRGIYGSRRYPNLWLVNKENGGWADALNAALNLARYPFVGHVDADCLVEPDALMRSMRPINFEPDEIIIVGAQLRVANGLKLDGGKITESALPAAWSSDFSSWSTSARSCSTGLAGGVSTRSPSCPAPGESGPSGSFSSWAAFRRAKPMATSRPRFTPTHGSGRTAPRTASSTCRTRSCGHRCPPTGAT